MTVHNKVNAYTLIAKIQRFHEEFTHPQFTFLNLSVSTQAVGPLSFPALCHHSSLPPSENKLFQFIFVKYSSVTLNLSTSLLRVKLPNQIKSTLSSSLSLFHSSGHPPIF